MQTKITQKTLGKIEETGKRWFIWDTSLVGFGIEVSAKGKSSYVFETRIKGTGRKVRRKIGSVDLLPLDDARANAKITLLKASQGVDPRFEMEVQDNAPKTVGQAVTDYIEAKRRKLAASTIRDYRVTFSSCLSDWEHLPLNQLSGQMVAKKYNSLLDSHSAAYCNKVMRNLRAALNYHDLEPNPVKFLTRKDLLAEDKPRNRFLSAREIHDIYGTYSTFKDRVARVVLFCILTGVRKNEALKLTWSNVTSQTIEFSGDIQKNHKPHHVPRVGMLNEILGDRGDASDLVFGFTQYTFRKPFDRFKARRGRANWAYWSMHDLRRTFSEHLNLVGYTASEVSLASNRSDNSVTVKHYLGGQLAKENLLRRMYADLQHQVYYYWYEGAQVSGKVAPLDYIPAEFIEPELTEEEWQDYQESLAKANKMSDF